MTKYVPDATQTWTGFGILNTNSAKMMMWRWERNNVKIKKVILGMDSLYCLKLKDSGQCVISQ